MKGFLISFLGVAAFIALAGFLVKNLQKKAAETPSQANKNLTTGYLTINNIRIDVELAQSEQQKAIGLAFRDMLRQYSGMLFDFTGQNRKPTFWMKDTSFPLDIIWIKNGKIVGITKNMAVEKPDTPPEKYKTYQAPTIIDYALEVNANWCDQNGVSVGDEVVFFLPSP